MFVRGIRRVAEAVCAVCLIKIFNPRLRVPAGSGVSHHHATPDPPQDVVHAMIARRPPGKFHMGAADRSIHPVDLGGEAWPAETHAVGMPLLQSLVNRGDDRIVFGTGRSECTGELTR
jgi:hypothetical protein